MKFVDSHPRSIAKTVTVRVLFTASHVLNGFIVTGTLAAAAKIATFATLINMFLFWAHERAWNFFQWNRKPGKADSLFFVEGHPRTISKSVTWRLLITVNNFLIPYLTTGSWKQAVAFLGLATLFNVIIYYSHERIWNLVRWGKSAKLS